MYKVQRLYGKPKTVTEQSKEDIVSTTGETQCSSSQNAVFIILREEMSANVYKMSLDQIVGPNGNKEFTDLVTILGCNVGAKFDINKLNYDKIIIASDADKPKSMSA